MIKKSDISKYDTEWQVTRIVLKGLDLDDKLEHAHTFLLENNTIANRERVINWLNGLAIAYKDDKRQKCYDFKDKLLAIKVKNINNYDSRFESYDRDQLSKLSKDLLKRCAKWLKNGYRNKELLDYTEGLLKNLKALDDLNKLEELIRRSHEIANTHKFLY